MEPFGLGEVSSHLVFHLKVHSQTEKLRQYLNFSVFGGLRYMIVSHPYRKPDIMLQVDGVKFHLIDVTSNGLSLLLHKRGSMIVLFWLVCRQFHHINQEVSCKTLACTLAIHLWQ